MAFKSEYIYIYIYIIFLIQYRNSMLVCKYFYIEIINNYYWNYSMAFKCDTNYIYCYVSLWIFYIEIINNFCIFHNLKDVGTHTKEFQGHK